jgi:Flp pilus assembly protein TadB
MMVSFLRRIVVVVVVVVLHVDVVVVVVFVVVAYEIWYVGRERGQRKQTRKKLSFL